MSRSVFRVASTMALRFGWLVSPAKGAMGGEAVEAVVDDVEDGGFSSLQVPGPIGVTGRLRNLYIDQDIRIAEGVQLIDSDASVRDVYIQERSDTVD